MKKILLWIGCGLVLAVVVLVLARNVIARKSVEVGAKAMTGFPLEIGSVDVGLFSGQLEVRDLKLMNPPEFQEKMFVDLPRFFVKYRLGSMISGAPHINDMDVNISNVVIVKNAQGETNVQKLKGVVSSASGGAAGGSTTPESSSKTKYRVDQVHIHIGKVIIKDFSKSKPSEREFPLNVDATYKDITDSTDITRLVLLTMMSQVHLPDIGIKADDLKKGLTSATALAGKALGTATNVVGTATKGLTDVIGKIKPKK